MSKLFSNHATIAAVTIAAAFMFNASAVRADEGTRLGTVKPLDALSFKISEKRAVGYFQSESGACKLVLTVAAEPDWTQAESFTASRFEAAIPAGKSTRYQGEGPPIDFSCHAGALAMSATVVKQFAADSIGK